MNEFTSQPAFPSWSQTNPPPPQSFWLNLAAMLSSGMCPAFGSPVSSMTPNSRSELFSQQMASQSSTILQNVNFNSSPSNMNNFPLSSIDNSSNDSLNLSAVSNSSGEASSNCATRQSNRQIQQEEMVDVIVNDDDLMVFKRYEVTPTTRMPTWLVRDDLVPSLWNLDTSKFPFEQYAGKLKDWVSGHSDLFTCNWKRFSQKTSKLMDKYSDELSKYYRSGINPTIRRQFCGVVGDRFPKIGERYLQFRKIYSSKIKLGAAARMQPKFKILGNSSSKTAFKSRNLADFLFYKLEQQMRYVKVSEKSTKPAKEIMKNGTSLAVCARNKKRKQTQNEQLDGEDGGDGSPIDPNDLVYPGEQGDAKDLLEFDAVIEEEDDDENDDDDEDDEDKENNASEI